MAKQSVPAINAGGLSELWARLKFLVLAIIVYRLGAHIPVPGINPDRLADLFRQSEGTILSLFNMFSGGALERMSILALGIMPYISASIIMQILTAVVPQLEAIKKDGESGRRKISQWTRYATVCLAVVQSFGISVGLASQGVTFATDISFYGVAVATFVAGSLFMMWLGEQITEHGIGNGISMLIFAGIVAGLPTAIAQSFEASRQGTVSLLALLLIAAFAIVVIALVVFIERGQRQIAINHGRGNQVGRNMAQQASQSNYFPVKVNMAGVIPAIFASSLLLFPASLGSWFGQKEGFGWLQDVAQAIAPGQPLNILLFSIGIFFFCFFYTALMFNPKEIAENLKKSAMIVPGIRPGEHTAKYIDGVVTRLTLFGAIYMTAVCLLPQFLVVAANVPFYLGGTSLLIVVVVVMDFMAQVQSHLVSQQYSSLMKKANLRGYKNANLR